MYSIGGKSDFDDYRVYVCEPKEIYLSMQRIVLESFKKAYYSNSSIKGDILSELRLKNLLQRNMRQST